MGRIPKSRKRGGYLSEHVKVDDPKMGRLGRFSRISGFAFPVRLLGGNQNHLSASENTVSFRNRFFLSWQILGCIYLFITHIHEREGGDIYMKSYTFLNYEVEARGLLQCVTINGHGHGRPTEPDKTKSKRNAWMEKRNARKERSTGRGGVDSQTGYTKVARLSNPGQAATGTGAPPGGGGAVGVKETRPTAGVASAHRHLSPPYGTVLGVKPKSAKE